MSTGDKFLQAQDYQILQYNTENLAEIVQVKEGDPKELTSKFLNDLECMHECLKKTVLEIKGEGEAKKKSIPPKLSSNELAQARAWLKESAGNSAYLSDLLTMPFVFQDYAFSRPKDCPDWVKTVLDMMSFVYMGIGYTKRGPAMHTDFHDVPTKTRNMTNMASVASAILYGSVFRMWGRVLQAHETYGSQCFMILETRQVFWTGARALGYTIASSGNGNDDWFEQMIQSYDKLIENITTNMENAIVHCGEIVEQVRSGEYFNRHRVLIPSLWYFVRYFEPRT